MEIQKLIQSTSYLETINKLDNVICELLYSDENGYTFLSGKTAIEEAQNVISKYELEAQKIVKDVNFDDIENIVKDKKQELIFQIEKHYRKEAYFWAYRVFRNSVDNCLLFASIDKNNKEITDKLYNRALCAISWMGEVENINEDAKKSLIKELNEEFKKALEGNSEKDILSLNPSKSNALLFLEIRSLIINDEEKFLNLNFNTFSQDLNKNDIFYFQKCQNQLQTNKKTFLKDEIYLVNSAIKVLNLTKDEDKYNFIKKTNDDIELFCTQPNSDEAEKIKLVQRRINLEKSLNKEKGLSEYYLKLLSEESITPLNE